jgi:hypothetical protein
MVQSLSITVQRGKKQETFALLGAVANQANTMMISMEDAFVQATKLFLAKSPTFPPGERPESPESTRIPSR